MRTLIFPKNIFNLTGLVFTSKEVFSRETENISGFISVAEKFP